MEIYFLNYNVFNILIFYVILISLFVLYRMITVGLYNIARNENYEYPQISYIPILGHLYMLGEIVKEVRIFKPIGYLKLLLPGLFLGFWGLYYFSNLKYVILILFYFLLIITFKNLLIRYQVENLNFKVISSAIFPPLFFINIYNLRDLTEYNEEYLTVKMEDIFEK